MLPEEGKHYLHVHNMPFLRWIVIFFGVFWPLATLSAAERVLLPADGQPVTASGLSATALRASSTVQALRAAAVKSGSVRVIVGFRVPFAPAASLSVAEARQQTREIATAATTLRDRFAAAIARAPLHYRAFDSIPFMALDVTPAELDRLAADPAVLSLTPDLEMKPSLSVSVPLIRAPEAWAQGYSGHDQVIAIIDSGVDKNHPFLAGKVVSEACYASDCPGGQGSSTASDSGLPCKAADCRHGTHVAGIAVGYLSPSFAGVAPSAGLISIRVFNGSAGGSMNGSMSDVLKALEHVFDLRNDYDIAAVNMSLGSTTLSSGSYCDGLQPAFTAQIAQLRAAGIVSVIASGNDSNTSAISFPACISTAVSVGSVSDQSWGTCLGASTAVDKVACYSNSAPILTLLAPGSPINSSVPGGGYKVLHGTSMAAPHVAGAIAVIRDKAPDASADEIVAALRRTGTPVTDDRNGVVTPRIDVKAATDQFVAGTAPAIGLTIAGNGHGVVTFSPAGSRASCSASCRSRYSSGTEVTLVATPDTNMVFGGWTGDCSGAGSCSVTMTASHTVRATFYKQSSGAPQQLSLTLQGSGTGTVSVLGDGAATVCASSCVASFGKGAMVKLTATPASGMLFASWSGGCIGRKATCLVRLTAAKSVTATFTRLPVYPLNVSIGGTAGGGVDVGVQGASSNCSASCSYPLPAGSAVSLTARPAAGKLFTGWQGICRGRKSVCTMKLRGPSAVTASFN